MLITTKLAIALALVALAPLAVAQEAEPLPPAQAFHLKALPGGPTGTLTLYWQMPYGYHLYQSKLTVVGVDGAFVAGRVPLPPAERVSDPFLGPTNIYSDQLILTVPYRLQGRHGAIQVQYQGCKVTEPRICYLPQTEVIPVG